MNNSIVLIGNIGQVPVLRHTRGTPATPVANASLATNRVFKDRAGNRQQSTEWHKIVVWGDSALNFAEIVGKGDQISVQGRLEYQTREIAGQKVSDAYIRVSAWTKLSARKPEAVTEDDGGGDEDDGGGDEGDGFRGDDGPQAGDVGLVELDEEPTGLADELAGEADPPAQRRRQKK